MKRRSIRDKRDRRRKTAAAVVLFISLSILGTIWMVGRNTEPIRLDSTTLCPEDGPTEYQIVLLDVTSPYSLAQRTYIHREVEIIKKEVAKSGQLSVYAVDEDLLENFDSVFRLCNPGDDWDKVSEWTGNPEIVRRQWLNGYSTRIDSVLDANFEDQGRRTSPIMETVQAIGLKGFPRETDRPVRIHIFSDMMQNSVGFTQYRQGLPDFPTFQKTSFFRRIRTNLSDARVTIHYATFEKSAQYQIYSHKAFWDRYFKANNAIIVALRPMEG